MHDNYTPASQMFRFPPPSPVFLFTLRNRGREKIKKNCNFVCCFFVFFSFRFYTYCVFTCLVPALCTKRASKHPNTDLCRHIIKIRYRCNYIRTHDIVTYGTHSLEISSALNSSIFFWKARKFY